MSRQSGRWTGRAFIAGGRAIVRQAPCLPSSQAVSTQTSRPNTISSKPPEKHQRSPSQPSCESSSCWQMPCFERIENGRKNPLDQNGYSSFSWSLRRSIRPSLNFGGRAIRRLVYRLPSHPKNKSEGAGWAHALYEKVVYRTRITSTPTSSAISAHTRSAVTAGKPSRRARERQALSP